jgi:hypothetical protein
MKSILNSIRIARVKPEWRLALALAAASIAAPSYSFAVPLATAQVSKFCEVQGGDYGIDQVDSGQQLVGQATSCNLTVSGPTPWGPGSAHAEGDASAGFGPGIPQIGITRAGAQIAADNGTGNAIFTSTIQYSFEIQPINGTPPNAPSLVPILFSAQGSGFAQSIASVGGRGSMARAEGITYIYGTPLYYGDTLFHFNVQAADDLNGATVSGGFDGTRPASLYTNYSYGVIMTAWCQAYGLSASCSAAVDPSVSFDQATFDAQMGTNTFALDQYYQFVFSPNLPVPEPEAYALMLAGLGLVGFAARRRSRF